MGQAVLDQLDDVIIVQSVKDMLALATIIHNAFAAQQFEPLRDRRQIVIESIRNLRHAQLLLDQQPQKSQPIRISQHTENGCRP